MYFVADSYGLEVAPQAHEDVQVGKEVHVVGFPIIEDRVEDLTSWRMYLCLEIEAA